MINEIGSEFWKENKKYLNENERLFLSGRTALDAIIKDSKKEHIIKSALLPSYCCHTMIEPFMRNNIDVRFYDVFLNDNGEICVEIPSPRDNELLYIMSYFGIVGTHQMGETNYNLWEVSVEDRTHSCFHNNYKSSADYEYTSYRKWFAIDGFSLATKKRGTFSDKIEINFNIDYCKLRNDAFSNKYRFVNKEEIDKEVFLNQFQYAEDILEENYAGYCPDINTIIEFYEYQKSFEEIRRSRRRNVEVLLEVLKDIEEVQLIISKMDGELCPIFFPIILPQTKRDMLRKYLIERKIYCPIHWPLTKYHLYLSDRAKKIYMQELSLVCDQRYGVDDMKRVGEAIQVFFRNI